MFTFHYTMKIYEMHLKVLKKHTLV